MGQQPTDRLPRPPYDAEMEPVVRAAAAAAADAGDFSSLQDFLDIEKLRREALERERPRTEALLRDQRVVCRDLRIPGVRAGSSLTLTVVRPAAGGGKGKEGEGEGVEERDSRIDDELRPCIFYIHGGAMVRSDRYAGLDMSVAWATELGAVTVSVEYGLAPENPGTGPAEECYAALWWVADQSRAEAAQARSPKPEQEQGLASTPPPSENLGIDPRRIVLYGVSAGGGLAAAVALMARDRRGPPLCGLLLKAPMLDDRNPSSVAGQQFATGPMYNSTINLKAWRCLLGDRAGTAATAGVEGKEGQKKREEVEEDKGGEGEGEERGAKSVGVSPYEAPGRATDLAGLPATYLDCGTADPFRDDAASFAARLWAGGVAAEFHAWPGCPHAFDRVAPDAALSVLAVRTRLAWLRRTFGIPEPGSGTVVAGSSTRAAVGEGKASGAGVGNAKGEAEETRPRVNGEAEGVAQQTIE